MCSLAHADYSKKKSYIVNPKGLWGWTVLCTGTRTIYDLLQLESATGVAGVLPDKKEEASMGKMKYCLKLGFFDRVRNMSI